MGKMISISDVSELTGVTIKTLKIWDKEGKLKAKYKTPGGRKVKKDIKKSFEELEKERGDSVENNN